MGFLLFFLLVFSWSWLVMLSRFGPSGNQKWVCSINFIQLSPPRHPRASPISCQLICNACLMFSYMKNLMNSFFNPMTWLTYAAIQTEFPCFLMQIHVADSPFRPEQIRFVIFLFENSYFWPTFDRTQKTNKNIIHPTPFQTKKLAKQKLIKSIIEVFFDCWTQLLSKRISVFIP